MTCFYCPKSRQKEHINQIAITTKIMFEKNPEISVQNFQKKSGNSCMMQKNSKTNQPNNSNKKKNPEK